MHMPDGSIYAEKPNNHKVLIVRIPEPRVHTNADSLELFDIMGYQIVAKKEQFKAGDLAVYIQPDSVLPQTEPFKWFWEAHIDVNGVVPVKYRRVTVRKFRKEWSEGMLAPLKDFMDPYNPKTNPLDWREGEDVSFLLGVTHYEPEEETSESAAAPKRQRRPKTVKGWLRYFYYNTLRCLTGGRLYRRESSMEVPFESPEYYVVAQKAARTGFPDDPVVITEKLHGSNGRFLFLDGVQYIGSHFQWKAPDTPCIFTRVFKQKPWIGAWCKANPGRVLYGEVIGDQKGYTYGLDKSKGELDFRAFDIWEPEGFWTKPWIIGPRRTHYLVPRVVPILYTGVADMETIKTLTDGYSMIDGKTQREGVVISEMYLAPEGVRRPRQVKRVSNVFLEKDAK